MNCSPLSKLHDISLENVTEMSTGLIEKVKIYIISFYQHILSKINLKSSLNVSQKKIK